MKTMFTKKLLTVLSLLFFFVGSTALAGYGYSKKKRYRSAKKTSLSQSALDRGKVFAAGTVVTKNKPYKVKVGGRFLQVVSVNGRNGVVKENGDVVQLKLGWSKLHPKKAGEILDGGVGDLSNAFSPSFDRIMPESESLSDVEASNFTTGNNCGSQLKKAMREYRKATGKRIRISKKSVSSIMKSGASGGIWMDSRCHNGGKKGLCGGRCQIKGKNVSARHNGCLHISEASVTSFQDYMDEGNLSRKALRSSKGTDFATSRDQLKKAIAKGKLQRKDYKKALRQVRSRVEEADRRWKMDNQPGSWKNPNGTIAQYNRALKKAHRKHQADAVRAVQSELRSKRATDRASASDAADEAAFGKKFDREQRYIAKRKLKSANAKLKKIEGKLKSLARRADRPVAGSKREVANLNKQIEEKMKELKRAKNRELSKSGSEYTKSVERKFKEDRIKKVEKSLQSLTEKLSKHQEIVAKHDASTDGTHDAARASLEQSKSALEDQIRELEVQAKKPKVKKKPLYVSDSGSEIFDAETARYAKEQDKAALDKKLKEGDLDSLPTDSPAGICAVGQTKSQRGAYISASELRKLQSYLENKGKKDEVKDLKIEGTKQGVADNAVF